MRQMFERFLAEGSLATLGQCFIFLAGSCFLFFFYFGFWLPLKKKRSLTRSTNSLQAQDGRTWEEISRDLATWFLPDKLL